MTNWISIAVLTLLASQMAFANGSATKTFSCLGSGSKTLEVEYDGPRYADSISAVDYDGDTVRPLMLPREQNLQISNGSLSVSLPIGTCRRGNGQDDFVSCTYKGPWDISSFTFQSSKTLDSMRQFSELAAITRTIRIQNLDLKVVPVRKFSGVQNKEVITARMRLSMKVQLAHGPVDFYRELDFGEVVAKPNPSGFHICYFE